MQKLKGLALGLIGAAALALPTLGMAQGTMDSMTKAMTGPDSGWLVGGSIGQSKFKTDCSGASCDDTDTAFRVFGGYMFNKNWGAELGYADLGKLTATGTVTGVSVTADRKSTAWDLVAVGMLPFAEKFNGYAKVGMYMADTKLSGTASAFGATASSSSSKSNSDLTYTLGLGYDFNKNLGVRAEWQKYSKVGSDDVGGKGDIDVYGVGVVYRFK
ncbi:MAG TPA: outer membrane beta-barrel protein [Burkholderiales bacterium]|jgi:OOP family OmpA-OmpF porin